jgi:ABC-type dipeptide/oligopeptide/nickel transport system permease subunit
MAGPWLTASVHAFAVVLLATQLIAAPRPFYCVYAGESYSFIWTSRPPAGSNLQRDLLAAGNDWSRLHYDRALWPLATADPYATDLDRSWKPPGYCSEGSCYLLGTWELGRSMGISLLYGFRKSLVIALLCVMIGLILGIPAGSFMSFYHREGIRLSRSVGLSVLLSSLVSFYVVLLSIHHRQIYPAPALLAAFLWVGTAWMHGRDPGHGARIRIWPDAWLSGGIGLVKSFPSLLLLLLLVNWVKEPGTGFIAGLLGFFLAFSVARYTRHVVISEETNGYVDALRSLGVPGHRIVIRHLIPKVLSELYPIASAALGSAVLTESTLSFLGLGLPLGEISLGSMMHSARNHLSAWWVVLMPGLLVFWMVFSFQKLGGSMTHQRDENVIDTI